MTLETPRLLLLLLQLNLHTPLPRLPGIMLALRSPSLLLTSRQSSNSPSNGPSNTIRNPLSEILNLALGLLPLTLLILLNTFLTETLCADKSTDGFFAAADDLVEGALGAVGIVFCYAGGCDAEGAGFRG